MNDNVNTLTLGDAGYPPVLINISHPPERLFWTGASPNGWLDMPKVAIVGSRKMTAYGKQITDKLAGELASAGVVIVSGLAFGVDITAHRAALAVGGITVAVLPSGIESIYPASHQHIARQITERGTLISEYESGMPSFASNFIARNRLISGLCDVLLITEAALKSGSLHTARFALEQGKTVMAVPGNINSPASEGCNNLIKSGAIPVTSADDVFFALKINPARERAERPFSGSRTEAAIIKLIKEGVTAQEELAAAAKLDGQKLAGALTMLEISGHIRPAGGGNWTLA